MHAGGDAMRAKRHVVQDCPSLILLPSRQAGYGRVDSRDYISRIPFHLTFFQENYPDAT